MKSNNNAYSTSQEILYTVCTVAWNLCKDHLQKFAALKPFYTEAFIADALQAVKDAKDLPESRQTIAGCKLARINLMSANRRVRANWQILKRYITGAFEESVVQTKLDEAGDAYYPRAAANNWSAVHSLIHAANVFISNNLDALTANGNMPAVFQVTFKAGGDNCTELSMIYTRLNMDKEMATGIKLNANNAIYASVIEMLKDGQRIFRNDEITKRQFMFNYLVSIHCGNGSASLKGKIINSHSMPVKGAVISSGDEKYTATTDSKGHYRISRIAAGTYVFTIACPGYKTIVQTITFEAATAANANFELASLMLKVA